MQFHKAEIGLPISPRPNEARPGAFLSRLHKGVPGVPLCTGTGRHPCRCSLPPVTQGADSWIKGQRVSLSGKWGKIGPHLGILFPLLLLAVDNNSEADSGGRI